MSGTVTLQGRSDHSGSTVETTPIGSAPPAFPNVSGVFAIGGLTPGSGYTFTASMPGYLQARRASVVPAAGPNPLPLVQLKGGDANNDSEIDILDVSLISAHYGSSGALTGGAADADINDDDTVNVLDLSLVASNFGLAGVQPW